MGVMACKCCGSCAIGSDDFAVDDLVTAWTVDSGAVAISGGTLNMTTSAQVVFNTIHPDSHFSMINQVDFSHNTSGKSCDVIVGYVDSTHFFYARYKSGTNTVEIRRNNGGVDTQLAIATGITINVGTTYTALVCVRPTGTITAAIGTPGGGTPTFKVDAVATVISGTQCGLATDSGNATFDNFFFKKSLNASGAATCDACEAKVSSPSACTDCCADLAGNLVVQWPGGLTDINLPCSICSGFTAGDYFVPFNVHGICQYQYAAGSCQPLCLDGTAITCADSTQCGPMYFIDAIFYLQFGFSGFCEIEVDIALTNNLSGGLLSCRKMAKAVYIYNPGVPIDFCDGSIFTLTLQTGSIQPGCGGSWPGTITVYKA